MIDDDWMEMMTTKIMVRGGAFGEMVDGGKLETIAIAA